jgi:hypothetical protein
MLRGVFLAAAASAVIGVVGSATAASGPTVAQIEAAIARHSDNFVLANAYAYGGQAPGHGWIDLETGAGRWVSASGQSVLLESVLPARHDPTLVVVSHTVINYTTRTWYRTTGEELANTARPKIGDPLTVASEGVRFTLVGVESVDGQQTYHLRSTYVPHSAYGNQTARYDVWFSINQDYLIRITRTTRGGNVVQRVDNHWLPRTSANLAHLTMAIPNGFKQVAAPA